MLLVCKAPNKYVPVYTSWPRLVRCKCRADIFVLLLWPEVMYCHRIDQILIIFIENVRYNVLIHITLMTIILIIIVCYLILFATAPAISSDMFICTWLRCSSLESGRSASKQFLCSMDCIASYLHHTLVFLKDVYCLSWISLNSFVLTIRRQLIDRKPELTLLSTRGIFNLPHHIYMVLEQSAFNDV